MNKLLCILFTLTAYLAPSIALSQDSENDYINSMIQALQSAPAKRLEQLNQSPPESSQQKTKTQETIVQPKIDQQNQPTMIYNKPIDQPALQQQKQPNYDSTVNFPNKQSEPSKQSDWQYDY